MIHLVTYASENMSKSQKICIQSALRNGVESFNSYGPENIDKDFYRFNKDILSQERGNGYWLFKPYMIYKSMCNAADDSIIIYSDAGVEFIAPVQEIVNRMDEDIFFFTNTFKQVEWTKGSIMDAILPEWRDGRYDNAMQVQASSIFFKVNQKTKDFVKEWLLFCQMPGLIDDSPSKTPNYPTFAENRHDQSILCALQIKYGYKLHWFPTTTAYHIKDRTPDDSYPAMFNHHRKRNNEW